MNDTEHFRIVTGNEMNIENLRIGMKVRHPEYGEGVVKALTEQIATIEFLDLTRELSPSMSEIVPAEATATISGTDRPLNELVSEIVSAAYAELPLSDPMESVEGLGKRWRGGKMVMHPGESTTQSKEVELETFFHKITMMRNNLRVLEQRINGQDALSSADKFDLQQYITKCYGSMTTFNVLFANKDDYFSGQKK